MKRINLLLFGLIPLLVALACNMPFGNEPEQTDPYQFQPSSPSSSNPGGNPPPAAQQVTIAGMVWHDACALPDGPLPNPVPNGCIIDGLGSAVANGYLEPGEQGIAGVSVQLISGDCKTGPIISMTTTDAQGRYSFNVATPGSYCILIDPLAAPNDTILIPGRWSFPQVTDGWAVYEFTFDAVPPTMGPADFGWDYQFLPAYSGSSSGSSSGSGAVNPPPAPSTTDTTPPTFTDAYANVTEAFYMTSACGPTEVLITAEIEDASGIADAHVKYRFMGDSGYVGSWHTAGLSGYGAGSVEHQFLINAGEAEFELFGENGSIQYQVFARDNAGNESSYPDGFVLGVPVSFCP